MTIAFCIQVSSEVRERDRARVQIVLNVPPLIPRLSNLPIRRGHYGRAEDISGAYRPVFGAIEYVCALIDVVHIGARGEAEPEPGGWASAVIRSLETQRMGSVTKDGEMPYTKKALTKTVVMLSESVCSLMLYPTDKRVERTISSGPIMFGVPLSTTLDVSVTSERYPINSSHR